MAAFDGDPGVRPSFRTFVAYAAPWDPIPDDAYTAAAKAKVLSPEHLAPLKPFLQTIKPMPAVFDRNVVKKLDGTHFKTGNKRELANQLAQAQEGAARESLIPR